MPYQILLVDDEADFCEEFRACFSDYQVLAAHSGQQALHLLQRPNMVDLVILDVSLPDKSGTEVLEEIKRLAPDLGIVILTGYGSKDVAVAALRGRADDYLEKPFDIEQLRETIERLIRHKEIKSISPQNQIKDKMRYVQRFLERNYHKKIDLNQAARQVYLSPKYLSRAFRENTGLGFKEYKLRVKVKKIEEVLKKTNQTINQIAVQFGYQNSESFIRIFKKLTGTTPQAWRRRKQRSRNKSYARSSGNARRATK